MYCGYCKFSSTEELELDNLRVKTNREELSKTSLNTIVNSRQCINAFLLGSAFVILFNSMPAWADDLQPTKQAKK